MYKNIILFYCLLLITDITKGQTTKERFPKLAEAFLTDPNDYRNYENLGFLVSQHYLELSGSQRIQIRKLLKEHARFSEIHLNPPGEGGVPITIRGTVFAKNGAALKNVQILVFHTDAHGYYAPDDPVKKTMNEPDARLFGYLTTDDHGHYSFTTIHPGTYPNKYEGRYIPQHIHFEIKYPGYQAFSIQMAFEDDPSMKDTYWKNWAAKANFPVVHFVKENGKLVGGYNIFLEKK